MSSGVQDTDQTHPVEKGRCSRCLRCFRARPGIEHGCVVELFVLVQAPRWLEFLAAGLLHSLLGGPFQIVDLDRQGTAHEIKQDLGHLATGGSAGTGQRGVFVRPDVLRVANIFERQIADLEQSTLLEIGRRDAPAPAEVAVQPIGQNISQGTPGFRGRGEANFGITRVEVGR